MSPLRTAVSFRIQRKGRLHPICKGLGGHHYICWKCTPDRRDALSSFKKLTQLKVHWARCHPKEEEINDNIAWRWRDRYILSDQADDILEYQWDMQIRLGPKFYVVLDAPLARPDRLHPTFRPQKRHAKEAWFPEHH